MALSGVVRRRLIGTGILGVAVLMLILGQTVLQGNLTGVFFLVYWLVCVGLTGLAIAVALADARAIRAELRRQNQELLEQAVKEIHERAVERNQQRKPGRR